MKTSTFQHNVQSDTHKDIIFSVVAELEDYPVKVYLDTENKTLGLKWIKNGETIGDYTTYE